MPKRLTTAVFVLAILVCAGSTAAQPKRSRTPTATPSADSLASVSQRGRTLAEYDSVSWLGGDAMTSLSFPRDSIRRLIARKTSQGWEVAAGELSASGSDYLMSYLSTPGIEAGPQWATTPFDPPEADTGYFARAARAIETSVTMFRAAAQRRYIATVVPASDGPWWWVYLYPAPSRPGTWPRGGDMRFRISADGRVITESRQLHESISEYTPRTARSGGEVEREVLADTPEDTDVFHVLQRRPALPELMTAGRFRYRIDVDGTIRLIGVR